MLLALGCNDHLHLSVSVLLKLSLLGLRLIAGQSARETTLGTTVDAGGLTLGQSDDLRLPRLRLLVFVRCCALLLLALRCGAEAAVGENVGSVLLLLSQQLIRIRPFHQLLTGLLEGLNVSLLLLESHLLLLVNYRLLNDGVDLFDGGAGVI